jgi:hypothetical protein
MIMINCSSTKEEDLQELFAMILSDLKGRTNNCIGCLTSGAEIEYAVFQEKFVRMADFLKFEEDGNTLVKNNE